METTINIYKQEGTIIKTAIITSSAERREEMMANDYVKLSWNDAVGHILPAGAYIVYEGERFTLLEPHTPTQKSENKWIYEPQFDSVVRSWSKVPFFFYTKDSQNNIASKEPDWSLTASIGYFCSVIAEALTVETGVEWSCSYAADIEGSKAISFQSVDIFSALNNIANEFETEWYADKTNHVVRFGKVGHGEAITLTVGENIGVPSVRSNKEGYYNRFYVFGSTRNITKDYAGSDVNNLVNKRLTLDPAEYPNGYIDTVDGLTSETAFSKVLILDDIYPRANLKIMPNSLKARLMYRLDEKGDKIQIGTDGEGNPVYDQYAIYYFRVCDADTEAPLHFIDETYSEEHPNGMLISGKTLSVHFNSGSLLGREFELYYHKDSERLNNIDGTPFIVDADSYEILFQEENNLIIPSLTTLCPVDGDRVILFNCRMPNEYVVSAQAELLRTALKVIEDKYTIDLNNYEVKSNKVTFAEADPQLSVGRNITYINGSQSLTTRVISITKKLATPWEQTITIGNSIIKGNTQTLKEEVANAGRDINTIASINNLTTSMVQSYNRAQQTMIEGFARIADMWRFDEEHPDTIFSKYNVYSQGFVSAMGYNSDNPSEGNDPTPPTSSGGMDETALAQWMSQHISDYLPDHSAYLTASSLSGYASRQWVGDNYVEASLYNQNVQATNQAISDINTAFTQINTNFAGIQSGFSQLASDMGGLLPKSGGAMAAAEVSGGVWSGGYIGFKDSTETTEDTKAKILLHPTHGLLLHRQSDAWVALNNSGLMPYQAADAEPTMDLGRNGNRWRELHVKDIVCNGIQVEKADYGFIKTAFTEEDGRKRYRIYFGNNDHYFEYEEQRGFHFSHGLYSEGFVTAYGNDNGESSALDIPAVTDNGNGTVTITVGGWSVTVWKTDADIPIVNVDGLTQRLTEDEGRLSDVEDAASSAADILGEHSLQISGLLGGLQQAQLAVSGLESELPTFTVVDDRVTAINGHTIDWNAVGGRPALSILGGTITIGDASITPYTSSNPPAMANVTGLTDRLSGLDGGIARVESAVGGIPVVAFSEGKITICDRGNTTEVTAASLGAITEHQSLAGYLTTAAAQTTCQPKGNYLTTNAAAETYQPKGSYLTTATAASTYQPKGNYVLTTALGDYVTTADAEATYQPKGSYLTTSAAQSTYQPKGDYALTSALSGYVTTSDAAATYQPKGNYALASVLDNYLTTTAAASAYQPKGSYLTTADASSTYQPKGSYLTTTDAARDYQPKGNYLTTTVAASTYQPKGNYALASALENYLTTADATATYQPKGNYALTSALTGYLTTADAQSTYQPKGSYLTTTAAASTYLSKSDATSTYQPKGEYVTATEYASLQSDVSAIKTGAGLTPVSGGGYTNSYLSKSGGTMTGPLYLNSRLFFKKDTAGAYFESDGSTHLSLYAHNASNAWSRDLVKFLLTGGMTVYGYITSQFVADTSTMQGLNFTNTSGTTIAGVYYHNTAQRVIINPCMNEVTDVWSDAEGKYSLRVGKNELTYNTKTILHSGNYSGYITKSYVEGLGFTDHTLVSIPAGKTYVFKPAQSSGCTVYCRLPLMNDSCTFLWSGYGKDGYVRNNIMVLDNPSEHIKPKYYGSDLGFAVTNSHGSNAVIVHISHFGSMTYEEYNQSAHGDLQDTAPLSITSANLSAYVTKSYVEGLSLPYAKLVNTNVNFGGIQAAHTTAEFVQKLADNGMLAAGRWIWRTRWLWANNWVITDTGCGDIQLSGSTIEVTSNGDEYEVKVTTAPAVDTVIGNPVANAIFVYRNNGSQYSPNWRRLVNANELGNYLPLTGGILSGNLTITGNLSATGSVSANYFVGSWLRGNTTNGAFFGNGNAAKSDATGAAMWAYGDNPDIFYTNSTERMRITGSGYVGIGIKAPIFTLDVTGDKATNLRLKAPGSESWMRFDNALGCMGYFGFSAANNPMFCQTDGVTTRALLHSNNYSDYVTKSYVDGLGVNAAYAINATNASALVSYISANSAGASNIDRLQSIFGSTPRGKVFSAQLTHNSVSWAIGVYHPGEGFNSVDKAYGGFFTINYSVPKYIGISNGSWEENTLLHSGNYSDYALPLTGGTLSGNLTVNGVQIGKGLVTENRAGIVVVSPTDVPSDIWLGANNTRYWSLTCRNSIESNSFGIYAQNFGYALMLKSNGYVGIGTTVPQYNLHVSGTLYSSGKATLSSLQVSNAASVHTYLTAGSYVSAGSYVNAGTYVKAANYLCVDQSDKGDDIGNGWGLSLYNQPNTGAPLWGMFMGKIATFGNHGSVAASSTYAIYFTIGGANNNSTKRGWVFQNRAYPKAGSTTETEVRNVFSISGAGNMSVSGTATISGKTTIDDNMQVNGGIDADDEIWSGTGVKSDGYVTALSDERLKERFSDACPDVSAVAQLPAVEFSWKKDGRRDMGSVAQAMAAVLPLCVHKDKDGWLSIDYGKAATMCAISVARKASEHEVRIERLERQIKELQNELETLKAS